MLERIERWCKENNTTIFALEKKCGLGNATIRSWATSSPRMDTLMKVAGATGIPVEELIQCKNKEEGGEKDGKEEKRKRLPRRCERLRNLFQ